MAIQAEDRMARMNDPVILAEATDAMAEAQTADDVRKVWLKFYGKIGHKRLARILIGRDPVTGNKVASVAGAKMRA